MKQNGTEPQIKRGPPLMNLSRWKEMSMFFDNSHYLQFPPHSKNNSVHALKDLPFRRWKHGANIAPQGSSSFNKIIVSFMQRGIDRRPGCFRNCSSRMQKSRFGPCFRDLIECFNSASDYGFDVVMLDFSPWRWFRSYVLCFCVLLHVFAVIYFLLFIWGWRPYYKD